MASTIGPRRSHNPLKVPMRKGLAGSDGSVKLSTLEIERRTGTVSAIHPKKRRVYLQSSEGHGRTSCCSLDALHRATMPTWFR